jgi:uncharacterized protein (DUF2141 family)
MAFVAMTGRSGDGYCASLFGHNRAATVTVNKHERHETNGQKNSPRRLLALASAHGSGASRPADRHDPRHPQCRCYLYVALFSKPDGFPDGDYSIQHTKLTAAAETLSVVFDDLAPGIYAVGAYHDENNNNRLDTDFIGYPTEGYALSNGIRAVISCPRFIDAAFAVGDEDAHVTLRIKY